jgi:hypothetical protein
LRTSRQPEKTPALRSISNSARRTPIVGLGERVYETTKLAALFDVLVEAGCAAGEILDNVNLSTDEVHSSKSRISLAELMAACHNAIRLSRDPHLPYRIGTSIHLSAYGMYGFAILCCPDFRKAMAFAELYHALAAPLATIEFTEQDGLASWVIEPNARAATDPQVYRFITEMQIGIHLSLMRDIMGPAFTPDQISLAYPQSPRFRPARGPDRMSLELCKPNQPDRLSLDMAGSIRKSRQQDDLPGGGRGLRRSARRAEIAGWRRRRDSRIAAPGYRQPSGPHGRR